MNETQAERESREMDEWVERNVRDFPPISEETRRKIVRLLTSTE